MPSGNPEDIWAGSSGDLQSKLQNCHPDKTSWHQVCGCVYVGDIERCVNMAGLRWATCWKVLVVYSCVPLPSLFMVIMAWLLAHSQPGEERPCALGWLADPRYHRHYGRSRVHPHVWCWWVLSPDVLLIPSTPAKWFTIKTFSCRPLSSPVSVFPT